jgi:ribosomal protein L37AE/L43A
VERPGKKEGTPKKKGCGTKTSLLVSRSDYLICPLCEAGRFYPSGQGSTTCRSCRTHLRGDMLETLRCISTLPDAHGIHACECDHTEMRRLLPDGIFHCPACGSEVLPIDASSTDSNLYKHGAAYWAGWMDGCFGKSGSFVDNPTLAGWEDPSDRLAYYRGHRAGGESRRAKSIPDRTHTTTGSA